jgi:hypothetical protein
MGQTSTPGPIRDGVDLGDLHGEYRAAVGLDIYFTLIPVGFGLVFLFSGLAAFGAVLLALGAWAAWVTWKRARRGCRVYAGGMTTFDHHGAVTSVVTWNDVAHLRVWVRVIYLVSAYAEILQCRLELHNGKVIDLAKPGYKEKAELVTFVQKQVAAALYPARVDEIVRTGRVTFGTVTLTDEGVHIQGTLVRWDDITRVELHKTKLKIWTGDRRPAVKERLSRIPDLAIMQHMMANWPVVESGEDEPEVQAPA